MGLSNVKLRSSYKQVASFVLHVTCFELRVASSYLTVTIMATMPVSSFGNVLCLFPACGLLSIVFGRLTSIKYLVSGIRFIFYLLSSIPIFLLSYYLFHSLLISSIFFLYVLLSSESISIAKIAAFFAPLLPIPILATGTPEGI